MTTTTVTTANFDRLVQSSPFVVLDFWAQWCGPCRMFAPIFDRVSGKHPDIVFGKVDTEAEPQLAAAFGISSIPTLAVIRDQVVLHVQPGMLSEGALENLIAKARAVDTNRVRREHATR